MRSAVNKYSLFFFLLVNSCFLNASEFDNLIIEVKNEGIFVDNKAVKNLQLYIEQSFDCRGKVILMIDRNIEYKKIPIIMRTLKEQGCEKIAMASI